MSRCRRDFAAIALEGDNPGGSRRPQSSAYLYLKVIAIAPREVRTVSQKARSHGIERRMAELIRPTML